MTVVVLTGQFGGSCVTETREGEDLAPLMTGDLRDDVRRRAEAAEAEARARHP